MQIIQFHFILVISLKIFCNIQSQTPLRFHCLCSLLTYLRWGKRLRYALFSGYRSSFWITRFEEEVQSFSQCKILCDSCVQSWSAYLQYFGTWEAFSYVAVDFDKVKGRVGDRGGGRGRDAIELLSIAIYVPHVLILFVGYTFTLCDCYIEKWEADFFFFFWGMECFNRNVLLSVLSIVYQLDQRKNQTDICS